MRHVFSSNREVVRVWASRSQDDGRAGNVNFKGDIIYSYGHYAIGRFVNDAVLIQSNRYSNSTAKHINLVSGAVMLRWRRPVFYVPNIDPINHNENLIYFYDLLDTTAAKFWAGVGRRVEWYYYSYLRTEAGMLKYAGYFGLKVKPLVGIELSGQKAKDKIAEIKQRKWNEVQIPKWLFYKKQLVATDLLKIKNAQVRAEFVRKLGIDYVISKLGKVVDTFGNYQLVLLDLGDTQRDPQDWQKQIPRCRPFLKMQNPSVPELWHVEGVHPDCKTVADAIQYRRYGQTFSDVKRKRKIYNWNDGKSETVDYGKVKLPIWKPEKLT